MDVMDEIVGLRHRLDYLTLVSEALWSFIADQGHTEGQLKDRIERIDLSDGRLDNHHIHRVTCTKCGAGDPHRPLSVVWCPDRRRLRCT